MKRYEVILWSGTVLIFLMEVISFWELYEMLFEHFKDAFASLLIISLLSVPMLLIFYIICINGLIEHYDLKRRGSFIFFRKRKL